MKLEIKQFAFLLIVFLIIIIICKKYIQKIKNREFFNDSNKLKIVILIITKDSSNDRWDFEKNNWLNVIKKNKIKYPNIDFFFIKCSDKNEIDFKSNTIQCKCIESFNPGIFQKTILSLKQLENSNKKYDFYIRTNLSTFFVFKNLVPKFSILDYKNEYIYSGQNMIIDNIKYISGTSIIMNNLSVKKLIKVGENSIYFNNTKYLDDVIIGKILNKYLNKDNIDWLFWYDLKDNFEKNIKRYNNQPMLRVRSYDKEIYIKLFNYFYN